jgi:two-component system sensor histidine kinase/response regulator
MVLATYLKKLGYEHTVCSNGKEAVNHFMAGKGDVIIMDIEMPIMDGREATRLIRAHEDAKAFDDLSTSNQLRPKMKRKPSTCIIALSGNARPGLMQDAYNTGLNDYLTKPCSMDELARMLTKWEHDRARRTAAATVDAVGGSA